MSPVALSSFVALAAASVALAQSSASSSFIPLASQHFAYPSQIPYQVDPNNGVRGSQQGYNICNSTTENQNSMCQTAFVNHIDDFCLWSSPKANETIGDTEGEEVAWCTKPGRGTRLIPQGAITGVQYMKTPDYVQVVGFIDQTQINLNAADFGGELDPHGADLRGNPLGGLVYSNAFPSNNGNNDTYQQVIEWHNFMGSGFFCFKVCDPTGPNAANFCQHIYDRIGVGYNCPNMAQNGTFETCEGENQDFPGVWTTNGQVMTYTQPPESLGPITTTPYPVRIPSSSNCVPYQSTNLFTALPTPTGGAASAPTGTGASASGSGASGSHAATRTGSSGSSPTATGAAAGSKTGGAESLAVSAVASIAGVVFAVAFLA